MRFCKVLFLISLLASILLIWTYSSESSAYTADYWLKNGNNFLSNGSYNLAITNYDKCIEIESSNAYAWINKGWALAKLNQFNEALKSFDKAIESNPSSIIALNGEGFALYKLGRYDEAITTCDRVIKLDPRNANAWNCKGFALKRLGRISEANAALSMATSNLADKINSIGDDTQLGLIAMQTALEQEEKTTETVSNISKIANSTSKNINRQIMGA